ncbi:MAG TPA: hypothetical protein GXX77_00285 [Candidatus Cloacimonetes bacterium]|nr:hypothetical protein [Candidatus Cloacimonadota bacterium]
MENPVMNLQQRLQKLLDQYAADKIEIEELKKENTELKNANMQLMTQLEEYGKLRLQDDENYKAVIAERDELKKQHQELEQMLMGIESIADDAIGKIDDLFPMLEEND